MNRPYFLIILLPVILAGCSAPEPAPVTYYEFYYDRMYPSSFISDDYPENYRVISAFRFAEPEGLPQTARQTIQNLLYNGIEYEEFTKKYMEYYGDEFTDMDKYKFDFDYDINNDPEWDKLYAEGWPSYDEIPLFHFNLVFNSYDIEYSSNNYIIYKHKWSSLPSDAAHGLYGEIYKTIDLQNKTLLELENVLLPQALETLENRILDLLQKQEVSPHRLYDEMPKPDTFLFDKNGIQLIWQPYSIAAYVYGIVTVTLPYREVRNLLTADGKRLRKEIINK